MYKSQKQACEVVHQKFYSALHRRTASDAKINSVNLIISILRVSDCNVQNLKTIAGLGSERLPCFGYCFSRARYTLQRTVR